MAFKKICEKEKWRRNRKQASGPGSRAPAFLKGAKGQGGVTPPLPS